MSAVRRRLGLVFGAASLLFCLSGVWPAAAGAATKAGDAVVIAAGTGATGAPLTKGTATTPWSLRLPTDASCPGDSASAGYKVQSYMVPASVDPGSLTFGSVGPLPTGTGATFREPLFATTSDPYVNAQTAAATNAGGPGPIINLPAVDLAVYTPAQVPPGTYNVGIACTHGGASSHQLDTYWNTQIVVEAQLAWTTVGGTHDPAPSAPPAGAAATSGSTTPTTSVSTAAGGGASSDASTRAARTAPKPDGAPPSITFPVSALVSHVPFAGSSRASAFVLAALCLVAMRICYLAPRSARLIPAVAR